MATFFWKVLLWVCLCLVLTFRVEAYPVCHERADAYELAFADMQGTGDNLWLQKINDGNCASIKGPVYIRTLSTYVSDELIRVVEFRSLGKNLYGLLTSLPDGVWSVRYDPEWENRPANVRQWFQNLKQPDNPRISCCGDADAYEADLFEQDGDSWVAIITGQGPEIATKPYIKEGTRIKVPNSKMKWDEGNPTGHGIIFIGSQGEVYCYVTPALL